MKQITTRELQHNTKAVRERVASGESFEWKIKGETVGYITPAPPSVPAKPWPNLKKRLNTLAAGKVTKRPTASDIIYADRGD